MLGGLRHRNHVHFQGRHDRYREARKQGVGGEVLCLHLVIHPLTSTSKRGAHTMSRIGRLPVQHPCWSDDHGRRMTTPVTVKGPKGDTQRSRCAMDMAIETRGQRSDCQASQRREGTTARCTASTRSLDSQHGGGRDRRLRQERWTWWAPAIAPRPHEAARSLFIDYRLTPIPLNMPEPQGITFEVPSPDASIVVKGIDKQLVGQVAADVRACVSLNPT